MQKKKKNISSKGWNGNWAIEMISTFRQKNTRCFCENTEAKSSLLKTRYKTRQCFEKSEIEFHLNKNRHKKYHLSLKEITHNLIEPIPIGYNLFLIYELSST